MNKTERAVKADEMVRQAISLLLQAARLQDEVHNAQQCIAAAESARFVFGGRVRIDIDEDAILESTFDETGRRHDA